MKTATEYLDLDNYKQYDKEIVLQMLCAEKEEELVKIAQAKIDDDKDSK